MIDPRWFVVIGVAGVVALLFLANELARIGKAIEQIAGNARDIKSELNCIRCAISPGGMQGFQSQFPIEPSRFPVRIISQPVAPDRGNPPSSIFGRTGELGEPK